MAIISLVLFLTTYLSLKVVTSNPVEDVSYMEGINFEYNSDKWICGDVDCPADTFGCKISIKSDEKNRKVVNQAFSCVDRDKTVTLSAGDIIEMSKEKMIDIDLETYVGAVTAYGSGYGLGHEHAKGVIAVNELYHLKETARLQKQIVNDLNG